MIPTIHQQDVHAIAFIGRGGAQDARNGAAIHQQERGFSHLFGVDWEKVQHAVVEFPSRLFGKNEGMFDWRPENIDVSDNKDQVQVIKHHYTNELGVS
jgi:hypothetical protein